MINLCGTGGTVFPHFEGLGPWTIEKFNNFLRILCLTFSEDTLVGIKDQFTLLGARQREPLSENNQCPTNLRNSLLYVSLMMTCRHFYIRMKNNN